jgi:hypothetical protein
MSVYSEAADGAVRQREAQNWGMDVDPSWDVMPVVNPGLPARKRAKLLDQAMLTAPIGVAEPA